MEMFVRFLPQPQQLKVLATLPRIFQARQLGAVPRHKYSVPGGAKSMGSMSGAKDPFRPAKRVAGQKQDVWYVRSQTSHLLC